MLNIPMPTSPAGQKSKLAQLLGLIAWLALCFGSAALGAIASVHAGTFYAQLTQPSWAPPAWLFGPVWSLLYTMMAFAAWRVWCVAGLAARRGLILFVVQLAVNTLWSWLFFRFHLGSIAFVEVILLWSLILATIVQFWRVQRFAAALLIPYLIWVTFAATLNFAMWQLNPVMLS